MNERGEIPGYGPAWACFGFGQPGHDYYGCPDCWRGFELYFDRLQLMSGVPGKIF